MSRVGNYARWRLPAPPAVAGPGTPLTIDMTVPTAPNLAYYVAAIILDCVVNVTMTAGTNPLLQEDMPLCFAQIGLDTRVLGTLVKANMTGRDVHFFQWLRNAYRRTRNVADGALPPALGAVAANRTFSLVIPVGMDRRFPRGNTDFALNTALFTPSEDKLRIQLAANNCYAVKSAGAVFNTVTILPYLAYFTDPRDFFGCVQHISDYDSSIQSPAINPVMKSKGREDPVDVWIGNGDHGSQTAAGAPYALNGILTVEDEYDGIPATTTSQQIMLDFADQFGGLGVDPYPYISIAGAAPAPWLAPGIPNLAGLDALPLRYAEADGAKMSSIQQVENAEPTQIAFAAATPNLRFLQGTVSRFDQSACETLAARRGYRRPRFDAFTAEPLDYDGESTYYLPRMIVETAK